MVGKKSCLIRINVDTKHDLDLFIEKSNYNLSCNDAVIMLLGSYKAMERFNLCLDLLKEIDSGHQWDIAVSRFIQKCKQNRGI